LTSSKTKKLTSDEALDLAPSAHTSIVVEEQRRFVAEASANCSWLVCSIFWLNLSSLLLTDSEEKRETRWSRREETRQRP
jgi:hypothetical protein